MGKFNVATYSKYTCTYKQLSVMQKTQIANKTHQIVSVHTKWNCLIPILSNLVKYSLFQVRKFGCKRRLHVSGKITTILRLISRNLSQMENKHQIMNVHTKWNCLIPNLSGLVKY